MILNFTGVKMGEQEKEGRLISISNSQQTELVLRLHESSVQMNVGLFNDKQNFCQIQLYKYIDKVSNGRMKLNQGGKKILILSHYIFSIK
ncbi:unnamed protein product [Paramecium primaurelia]|uniref:Uncharacterized protein n=1 Tax=Paramecium primaurelia TaxID=5886 RepID=A0A8S1LJN3_PARPR|nr:unnamed protein product [Paramecium primaurelia]